MPTERSQRHKQQIFCFESPCSSTLTFHTSKELSHEIITQRSYTNGSREKRAVFRGNSRVQPPQIRAVHLMRGGKHPRVFSRVTKLFISWSTLPASSNNFLFSHMASLSTHMQRHPLRRCPPAATHKHLLAITLIARTNQLDERIWTSVAINFVSPTPRCRK